MEKEIVMSNTFFLLYTFFANLVRKIRLSFIINHVSKLG